MKRHAYEWIVWAFFLGVAVMILWQSSHSLTEQGVASGGPMENAAFFPRTVAWLIIGLSVVNAIRIAAGKVQMPASAEATATTGTALLVTGAFVVYLLLLRPLGYYLSTPLLLACFLWLLQLGWIKSIAGAVVMTIVVAGVFEGLLNVVLPVGILQITLFG